MSDRKRILVVEDSATQALRIRETLEQAGFAVACAASAEAALASLNHGLPDLLLTDFRLPGMLGDELCRTLRMNVNTRGIPILMFTGEQESGTERRLLESGADDYVPKSEDLDFVLLRIESLLRKSQVRNVVRTGGLPFAAAKLLLVDDSPAYLELLAAELEKEGYRIKTASTGAQALERLAVEDFDGIVLDLMLPDMSGMDICRCALESRGTLDDSVVILALTASKAKERMTSVLAAGADDVVEKSRDVAVIKARLRALLRRKLISAENRRISEEFRGKELEILRARAEKEAAEARAALVGQLQKANRELKEAQEQLVQSAKMASLGQLVAGVAHEINNPLAFVMNHRSTVDRALETLAEPIESHLSEAGLGTWRKARQRLGEMNEGLERIKDLVLKLRTFSRLDEGELKYVRIDESIESVLTLLHYRLKDRIAVKRNYGGVKVIPCYPGPLNQVLMNIVSNAIDAIDGKGEIAITTGKSDSMFFISVADTGKGMPEAVRERIFEPFYTTKPVGAGTGLGLSISYGIVKRHGGMLEVRSEEGRGTEMIVRIPLHLERKEEAGGGAEHE